MFEGSLVASRGLEGSGTGRWTALGSVTLQCALAGLLLAVPMLRPGSIPMVPLAPRLVAPEIPRPVVLPVQTRLAAAASTALSVPATVAAAASGQRLIFTHPDGLTSDPAPPMDPNLRMGMGGPGALGVLSGVGDAGPAAVTRVVTRGPTGPLRVSELSAGMLLSPIRPVYPAMARMAGVQGTVVVEATISRAGRIESLRVVSGPAMLRGAALDAVAAARYQPYKLNGEATEVQTTVTVMFRLGE
jgi:protein TonB